MVGLKVELISTVTWHIGTVPAEVMTASDDSCRPDGTVVMFCQR